MTERRYLSYRRALRAINQVDPDRAGRGGIELLRQVAEDLLLSREPSADSDELAEQAAIALTHLTVRGVVTRALADEVWRSICASGPIQDESLTESARGQAAIAG